MGVDYKAVQWNRQKKLYDSVLVGGVAAYLAIFGVLTKLLFPRVTDEILIAAAGKTGSLTDRAKLARLIIDRVVARANLSARSDIVEQ